MNAIRLIPPRSAGSRFILRPFRSLALLVTGLCLTFHFPLTAADPGNIIVLDEAGVNNLRIETVEVEETAFEATVFSLGRIEVIPRNVAAVSSRISGRVLDLRVSPGDTVKAGDEVAKIESRQPGDPPPVISLKAPLGGLVTHVDVRLGDPVDPEKPLLEITNLDEVYAIARVPEHQAGMMPPATKTHIKVAALPQENFGGELLRFGTSADKESGTIDAIFRLKNPGGHLRAGMRTEFSIVVGKRENVISIPRAALQGEASNRFVYVKDFDLPNAFVKTRVQVGEMNDRFVEITSGLLPADEVVTRGAYSLSFAGANSISLKDALDAAHGHEHAADGSELTPEKIAEEATEGGEGAGHGHEAGGVSTLWRYASIALFILLVISLITKRRPAVPEEETTTPAEIIAKEAR